MNDTEVETEPMLFIVPAEDGSRTSVELRVADRIVSSAQILHMTIRIGEAHVRMDGIGAVGTDEAFRKRGFSRLVLEACVKEMTLGTAALSMLYGIRDFYPKFGYATAGPDHLAILTDLQRDSALPEGWTTQRFETADLPAVQSIYAQNAGREVGAAVRAKEGGVWASLLQAADGTEQDYCRVVVNEKGEVRGYVWRAKWCWYVKYKLETDYPNALVLGEVMASCPKSAVAVLAASRQWAQEEASGRKVEQVVFAAPSESFVAGVAMLQDVRLLRNFSACGGSMARVLSLRRLLVSLVPELKERLRSAKSVLSCDFLIETELEQVVLRVEGDSISIYDERKSPPNCVRVKMSQTELARLALGAFPPEEILAKLPEQLSDEANHLISALFPARSPHMHLPDRY